MGVVLLVGTAKGGFICRADDDRRSWSIEPPLFKGWKVTAAARDANGNTLVATASDVYGAAIHVSRNLRDWRQIEHGPAYTDGGDRKLTQIWKLAAQNGTWYAGVSEAGLFRSHDAGQSWEPVSGLNDHRTQAAWAPGAGGLCAHSLIFDHTNPKRMWCGISAVGVFRTDDGGETWQAKNDGIQVILEDKTFPEIGFCVHALAQDVDDPNLIYRQDHSGMYRTRDGGDSWQRIENGLASRFGFPIVMDRQTGNLFVVPLESDEYRVPKDGQLRVFRSSNGGESWEPLSKALPHENAYTMVLRGAMDVDNLNPGGVYAGTTSGDVFASADGGESWQTLPCRLPRILSVAAFVEN